MKVAIFILCLLPLAFCEKRVLLGINGPLVNPVTSPLTRCSNALSLTTTEQECEVECRTECLYNSDILELGCDFVCKGIQNLIKLIPHNSPSTAATR